MAVGILIAFVLTSVFWCLVWGNIYNHTEIIKYEEGYIQGQIDAVYHQKVIVTQESKTVYKAVQAVPPEEK